MVNIVELGELRECPFCEGEVEAEELSNGKYTPRCTECGASNGKEYTDMDELIEDWNTRPEVDELLGSAESIDAVLGGIFKTITEGVAMLRAQIANMDKAIKEKNEIKMNMALMGIKESAGYIGELASAIKECEDALDEEGW